jgi:hypothetical protein
VCWAVASLGDDTLEGGGGCVCWHGVMIHWKEAVAVLCVLVGSRIAW